MSDRHVGGGNCGPVDSSPWQIGPRTRCSTNRPIWWSGLRIADYKEQGEMECQNTHIKSSIGEIC
jgi:hypothetical protein